MAESQCAEQSRLRIRLAEQETVESGKSLATGLRVYKQPEIRGGVHPFKGVGTGVAGEEESGRCRIGRAGFHHFVVGVQDRSEEALLARSEVLLPDMVLHVLSAMFEVGGLVCPALAVKEEQGAALARGDSDCVYCWRQVAEPALCKPSRGQVYVVLGEVVACGQAWRVVDKAE